MTTATYHAKTFLRVTHRRLVAWWGTTTFIDSMAYYTDVAISHIYLVSSSRKVVGVSDHGRHLDHFLKEP